MNNNYCLSERNKNLLIMQGFSEQTVTCNPNILRLSKWTPFACGIMGLTGLIIASPYYFIILGLLTFIGVGPHSLYDYFYIYVFKKYLKFGDAVPHGIQRKIGCGIGAVMYTASGFGFLFNILPLAYIPSSFMIIFAFIAGFSNWCFVSSFYRLFNKKSGK